MPYRRFIACLLALGIGLAACAPAPADGGAGAIRRGSHLMRGVEAALAVRTARSTRPGPSGQHRSGVKAWTAGSHDSLAPVDPAIRPLPARSVDTLPGHWGARHLTI